MAEGVKTISVTLEDLQQLVGQNRLYAIFDTCDAPDILNKVESLGAGQALCLYRGEISSELLAVAPYLVKIDNALLGWIAEKIWQEPWGIFIVAQSDFGSLRKHLRKFLMVQDVDGGTMYFRYYDPRILPAFLLSCNAHELVQFFGEVTAFGLIREGDGSPRLIYRQY